VSAADKGCSERDWREQRLNAIFLLIPRCGGVSKGPLNLDKLEQVRSCSNIQPRLMQEISVSITFTFPPQLHQASVQSQLRTVAGVQTLLSVYSPTPQLSSGILSSKSVHKERSV